MQLLSSLGCFLCLLALVSACYIKNCPRGGKRSNLRTDIRQCAPCGPNSKGQCFGSNICCGQEIGCYMGTLEAQSCKEENQLPSPCEPAGKPCGEGDGKCAIPGLCCDNEKCATDTACLENAGKSMRRVLGRNLSQLDNTAAGHLLRLLGPSLSKTAGKN
ncbi:oxytocin-neurophysin 1-like [Mobula hypostoma]|uniref:oxytocin-neurophysin 1-like n=1 Tax=Mobula hypostoma TaxID=723540 RepID=UPI002FC27BA9